MTVYLAARYEDHPLMREWRDRLEAVGLKVRARWIDGDHEISGADDDGDACRFATEDMVDLQAAYLFIARSDPSIFGKGRGGRHVELGLAIAWGKQIMLVGERENVFHWLPKIHVVPTFDDAIVHLVSERTLWGRR